METARYLIAHPELDADWEAHANHLVDFVTWALVENEKEGEPGMQFGARAVSEQRGDQNRMVSHTSCASPLSPQHRPPSELTRSGWW